MTSQRVNQSSGVEPRFFYGFIVVAAAVCIMALMYSTRFAFGIFFKPMLTDFGWTRAITSGALSLSLISQGLFAIIMGGLNDKFGPRISLTLCGFFVGLGYLLMSQMSAVWHLYMFYGILIGAGMSGVIVPLTSTVARWFVARRNTMTGIVVAGTSISGLITPPVANQLIIIYNWRLSYIILGGVVMIAVISAAQFLRRDPGRMGQVPYGENKGGEQGFGAGTDGFSLREAVKTRQLWMVFALFFCLGFCMFAIMVHIAPHITDLRISATSAASIFAAMGGASIVGNIVMGIVADKIGNKQVFIIGFILMLVTLLWLVIITEVWIFYLFAVVFGFAFSGCVTSESPLVARLFGVSSHGIILGVITFGFTIGGATGPFVAGYIFDFASSYQVAFLICATIGFIGAVLTALLTPMKSESRKTG